MKYCGQQAVWPDVFPENIQTLILKPRGDLDMNEKTILVIDDSSTIRRLVDTELGSAGYRVLMAATAEQGIATAREEVPDLIILDHQLPGITGYEVCCQLNDDPDLKSIPVVCSSTLRKKAYAEYTELANVIDMLPKPYTPDLLRTIVANALETAAMVVHSQSGGTAVPEVIDEMKEGDLSGSFQCFTVRELVDFLNNTSQAGSLEMDFGRTRVSIHLDNGRVQAVTASGIDPEMISQNLPEAISDLAPMIKFTLRGRSSSEIDGLVDLLDNKVLDARLLRQLLRHQAAALTGFCMSGKPNTFRFLSADPLPKLFGKLPLDSSLAALLVDGALLNTVDEIEESEYLQSTYSRAVQRGQNLDRSGLAAQHIKLLNAVATPVTIAELASQSGLATKEVYRVIQGFVNADLVVKVAQRSTHSVIAMTGDAKRARSWADFFRVHHQEISGKVVRDALAVKLLSRRNRPDVIVFDGDCAETRAAFGQLVKLAPPELDDTRWVIVTGNPADPSMAQFAELADLVSWDESVDGMRESFACQKPQAAVS
jgi:CheY-like chemotaxis protein